MRHNIPVAVVLGVLGSFCFALAAHMQHGAVRVQVEENAAGHRLSVRQLWSLLHSRRWWSGIGLMTVALICQVLGLSMSPVTVYQPLQLLGFPWSVLLSRKTIGTQMNRVIPPTAVTVAATAGFVLLVALNVSDKPMPLEPLPIIIGAGVVYAIAALFALMGSHGHKQWRCLFWASGGALFYGLEASLVRAIIQYAQTHVWWQDPLVWVIVPALVGGSALAGVMGQHAYATGTPEVVVASMNVTSPVVAVMFGILVLGEGSRLTPVTSLWLVLLGIVAVGGVVVLARVSGQRPAVPVPSDVS